MVLLGQKSFLAPICDIALLCWTYFVLLKSSRIIPLDRKHWTGSLPSSIGDQSRGVWPHSKKKGKKPLHESERGLDLILDTSSTFLTIMIHAVSNRWRQGNLRGSGVGVGCWWWWWRVVGVMGVVVVVMVGVCESVSERLTTGNLIFSHTRMSLIQTVATMAAWNKANALWLCVWVSIVWTYCISCQWCTCFWEQLPQHAFKEGVRDKSF